MELVYLWVEEYKNIKNQGFNFSPRFECKYDENTKELTINENKDYVNIFPKNINITAIVGENGSGKSNTYEALLSNFMSMIPIDKPFKVLTIFYNDKDDKIYYKDLGGCSIKINKEYLYENVDALLKYKISNMKDTGVFTFHYNYGLDWIYNNENNLNFNKLFHKTDNYKTPILLQPNKVNNQIHISNIDYLAIRDILNFTIHKNISFDFINEFFTATKCKLSFELTNISKRDDNHIYNSILKYYESSSNTYIEKLIYLSRAYIIRKTFSKGDADSYSIIKDMKFKENFQRESLHEKNLDTFIEYITDKKFEDLYNDDINYKIDKIKQTFLFVEYLQSLGEFDSSIFSSFNTLTINENKDLLLNLAPWIEIEFLNDNDVSFYSLSYGQKFLVKFIYSLLSQLYNLTSHKEYQDIVLLLDEVELGLHPNWQKKYLSILMNVLNTKIEGFDFKYNIICSTHSPFILSDLPKENVIFLKNGKHDNPYIEQTFGANIHTLLSHGFFMEDGLMGEFAKSKIRIIQITYKYILHRHKQKSLNKKEHKKSRRFIKIQLKKLWYIQSIIGEKFLQTIMKNYLQEIEQILFGNEKAIDNEIKRLQNLRKSIKNAKN
jgi:uncharacterized protein YlaN (UPF0358 family)